MENDEITAAEAAELLGVSATHVRWYHRQGLLTGRRIGERLLVFRRAEVEAFDKPKKTGRPAAKPSKPRRAPAKAAASPVPASKPRRRRAKET